MRFNEYDITTEDGYILKVYRVRTHTLKKGAPAVLLWHGLADSAFGWIAHHF